VSDDELRSTIAWANRSLDSVKERMWAYEDALKLIAEGGCERHTSGSCRDENSGLFRQSPYGAFKWCDACVAADALERKS